MARPITRKGRIKKLDKIVTDILRLRDKVCVTCGRPDASTSSHYITRRWHATRWDLTNCNLQCRPCNYRHGKDPAPYSLFMVKKYGKEAVERLSIKARKRTNYKNYDLDDIYEELTKIYKEFYS